MEQELNRLDKFLIRTCIYGEIGLLESHNRELEEENKTTSTEYLNNKNLINNYYRIIEKLR